MDGYRSSPTSLSSLLSFPALSSSSSRPPPSYLSGALRTRGGSKVAPPKKTNRGTGSSSKPILGPITRQSAADSAAKDDKALEDGQQEFSPQFLDFQSRVGFMKKVGWARREIVVIGDTCHSVLLFFFFRYMYFSRATKGTTYKYFVYSSRMCSALSSGSVDRIFGCCQEYVRFCASTQQQFVYTLTHTPQHHSQLSSTIGVSDSQRPAHLHGTGVHLDERLPRADPPTTLRTRGHPTGAVFRQHHGDHHRDAGGHVE